MRTSNTVSAEPLSFWGGYNYHTGEITDRRHPLSGQVAAGRVLGGSTHDRFAMARRLLPEHEAIFREAADTLRIVLWLQGRVGIRQGTGGTDLPFGLSTRGHNAWMYEGGDADHHVRRHHRQEPHRQVRAGGQGQDQREDSEKT